MANKRNVDPVQRAQQVLEAHNVRNFPVPVDKIAKALGAQLRFSPLDDELSGMIYIKDDIPIIGVNALHHPNRQRFTIAHEIGHLELHRDVISASGAVHVDKDFAVSILNRDSASAAGTNLMEIQANQFASELLMPRQLLEQVLGGKSFDIEDAAPLEALAKKIRVSKQALEYRIGTFLLKR
jgi:Zn-dependent peptidase ImmA (M78 family)